MYKNHEELKKLARRVLKDMGFRKEQIKEEYYFHPVKGIRYMIDVVGISQHWEKPHLWVAIECGKCKEKKKEDLKKFFDFVIHIPYYL